MHARNCASAVDGDIVHSRKGNKMKLKVIRVHGTEGFTEGKLYIDDVFECYTVEDEDRHLEAGGTKVYGQTAIPKGTYDLVLSMSPRFKKVLPEILNVPGFSGIRIHTGNSSKDTEGCIILGKTNDRLDDNWISGSKDAMTAFMAKLETAINNGEKVTIEIS